MASNLWICECGKEFLKGKPSGKNYDPTHTTSAEHTTNLAAIKSAATNPLLTSFMMSTRKPAAASTAAAVANEEAEVEDEEDAASASAAASSAAFATAAPAASAVASAASAFAAPMRCGGYQPSWPAPFASNFPATQYIASGWPFSVTLDGQGGRFRSYSCTGVADYLGGPCAKCAKLENHVQLQAARKRAAAPTPPIVTAYQYLTPAQTMSRLQAWRDLLQQSKLSTLNMQRRIAGATATMEMYGQVVKVMASTRIPRLRQVLAAALTRGVSLATLVATLKDAADGLYAPKALTRATAISPISCFGWAALAC